MADLIKGLAGFLGISVSDTIALLAVLVAAASLIVAIVARVSAARSAKRAATAGERAEDASERATRAAERMASIQTTIHQGAAWSLELFGDTTYLVTNTSALPAENVTLVHDPHSERMTWQDVPGVTIQPWSATMFMIGYGLNSSDSMRRDIVVTWNRPDETELRTWRHPVPLRSVSRQPK